MAEQGMTVRTLMAHTKGIEHLLPQEVLAIKIGDEKFDKKYAPIKKFFIEAIANKKDADDAYAFLKELGGNIDKRLKRPH